MDRRLLEAIEGLKTVQRKGWVESGVKDPESVADHTFAVALCVLFSSLKRDDIDRSKALSMALIHDLAEAVVGDITPSDGVPKEEKLARERKGLEDMLISLDEEGRKEIMGLWDELAEEKSPEARLVLDADVFERTVQAKVYKDRGEKVERFFGAVPRLEGTGFDKPLKDFLG